MNECRDDASFPLIIRLRIMFWICVPKPFFNATGILGLHVLPTNSERNTQNQLRSSTNNVVSSVSQLKTHSIKCFFLCRIHDNVKSANRVMSFRSRLKCFLLNMSSLLSLVPYIGWLTTWTRNGYMMLAYIVFAGHANELGDLLILAK